MRTLAISDEGLESRATIQLSLSPLNREIRPLDESCFTNLYTRRYHVLRFSHPRVRLTAPALQLLASATDWL
jgi:hypothetical protein